MERKKIKNALNYILLFAITVLVLFFSLKDHFQEIMQSIFTLNPLWFLLGIFLFLGSVSIRSIGLWKLVKEFKPDFRYRDSLRLSFMTQFFNAITPFATGGQPFQVYHLKKSGVHIADSTNIIVQNFIVYQIALVSLGILAVFYNHYFHLFQKVGLLKHLVTLGFIANTCVAIGLIVIAFAKNINKKIISILIRLLSKFHLLKNPEKTYQKWEDSIERFHNGANGLLHKKKLLFETIFLNFAGLCALYIIPLTVAFSMGYFKNFNGIEAIVSSAYVMLIGSFVPIPGGTGGLEYGFIQFYGNFLTGPALSAVMLIWRFITYYFGIIVGSIALNLKGEKL